MADQIDSDAVFQQIAEKAMDTTPPQPKIPMGASASFDVSPTGEELSTTQKLQTNYERQKSDSFIQHAVTEIKASHPELKDATDMEALAAVHAVDTPDASPEEFWKVLHEVHGPTWVPPKPPSFGQMAGAVGTDFIKANAADIMAIPKGLGEMAQAGHLALRQAIPGQGQDQDYLKDTEEAKRLSTEGATDLTKGGIFMASMAASEGAIQGLRMATDILPIAPFLEKSMIGRVTEKALGGAVGFGTFGGAYEGAKQATQAPTDAGKIWNSFLSGVTGSAPFGAALVGGIGVGAEAVGGVQNLMRVAKETGIAAKNADSLRKANSAAARFANIFPPELAPPDLPPGEFATQLIGELHGKDVVDSPMGKKSVARLARRITVYQDNFMQQVFAPGSPETPAAAIPDKVQVMSDSGPLWEFSINTSPGVYELHNTPAATIEDARQIAQNKAGLLGGTLEGDVSPQYERRGATIERRAQTTPVEVERRTDVRRAEDIANLQEINNRAKTDVLRLASMPQDDVIKEFLATYPNQSLDTFSNWEEVRKFMVRQASARLQGSAELIPTVGGAEGPRAQVETASLAELSKAMTNPKFRDEWANLAKNGASDSEIEDLLRRSLGDRYGSPISEMALKDGKVYAGYDPSLIRKLASRMYQTGLGRIVPKELIQNAVDSVRGRPNAKIDVEANSTAISSNITISDNGTGMTPDIVQKELTDLGASTKPDNSSGGFGLAKAALFSSAKNIYVETTADVNGKRVTTVLHGSGEEWSDPSRGLKISILHQIPQDTPTGTKITLEYPKKDADGTTIDWQLHHLRQYAYDLHLYHQLPIDFTYTVNGDKLLSGRRPMNLPKLGTVDLPGATVNIFAGGPDIDTSYPRVMISNRGLPQFSHNVPLINAIALPSEILVDVNAKVNVDHLDYPFTTNREQVSPLVQTAIEEWVKDHLVTEASRRERGAYKEVLENSPKIGRWSLIDPSAKHKISNGLVGSILNAGPDHYEPLLQKMDDIFGEAQALLSKHGADYSTANFHGLTLSEGVLGINIDGSKTVGGKNNFISINPWLILDEVKGRERAGITGSDLKSIANDFSWQVYSTIIHELAHQQSRGHTEAFAGFLTRILGHVGEAAPSLVSNLERWIINENPTFFGTLTDHLNALKAEYKLRGLNENLFKKVSDDLAGHPRYRGNERIAPNGPPTGAQSEKSLSPIGTNAPRSLASGSKGIRNFSDLIRYVRQKMSLPVKHVSAAEAQINPIDYLPVQRLGLEEIPIEGTE